MKEGKLISPCSPTTLHKQGVDDCFIWMIAWVMESLIGNKIPHVGHHSYLEEAIEQQGDFHLHPPLSHVLTHLGGFVVKIWWGLFMRRPQEEGGRNFSLPLQFLEDKKNFGGGEL